jgi:hypothetical protein
MHLLSKEQFDRRHVMKRTISGVFVLIFAVAIPLFPASPKDQQEAAQVDADNIFVGRLVDQACKERHIDHNCPVSGATERFGLVIDGGVILPFDEASNQMAKDAVAKGNYKGNPEVSVVGGRQQGAFKAESITAK